MMRPTPVASSAVPLDEPPHDCVVELPSPSSEWVQIAAYDSTGELEIQVLMRRRPNLPTWHRWLLRYVRRHDSKIGRVLRLLG